MRFNSRIVLGLAACGLMTLAQPVRAQSGSMTGTQGKQETGTRTQSGAKGGTETKSRTSGSASRMSADSNFLTRAAEGSMAEVELGQLAKERASNESVKTFAQRMIDDHGNALTEAKKIAADKSVTIPEKLDAQHMATKNRLSKLSGAEFDRAYMADMVRDHKQDVNEFQQHSQKGTDPEIKAFAAKTLPTLQEHLRLAQSTESELRGARTGQSNRESTEGTTRKGTETRKGQTGREGMEGQTTTPPNK